MRRTGAERILKAALKVIEEEGPTNMTLRGIARAAGVTEPALYRHFGSKRDLLRELFGYCSQLMYAYLEERAQGSRTPVEQLGRLGVGMFDFALEHPEEYVFIVAVHNQELRDIDVRSERLPKDLFVEAVEALPGMTPGPPAALVAGTIIGAVMGVVLFHRIGLASSSCDECRKHILRTVTYVAEASRRGIGE